MRLEKLSLRFILAKEVCVAWKHLALFASSVLTEKGFLHIV